MKKDNKITKRELKNYAQQVRKRAKKFKLKSKDAHNLYDLYWMTSNDVWKTLKLNKMDKWFYNFTKKIELVVQGENIAFTKKKGGEH